MQFRRMVTPVVIQILFILGLIAVVITGIVVIALGAKDQNTRQVLTGIGLIIFGPLAVRIYAEVLIVVFRINETLTDIRALAIWTAEREYGYGDAGADEQEPTSVAPLPAES